MIVGNPIIMILKAILNWFRLRRDYIANAVDKIPPEIKDALVAWYSPKKQKLNNYDVIESYAEDFTRLNYDVYRGTIDRTPNKIVITESKTDILNIIENINTSTNDIVIKVTGVSEELKLIVKDINSVRQYISKDGVYKFTNNVYQFFGFGINKVISGINVVIEQLPTSILKDFSGNKHDAYMYGFQGKLNSGIGIYNNDFTDSGRVNVTWVYNSKDITINGADSFTVHNNYENWVFRCTTNVKSMTVKIVGVSDDVNFKYRYESANGDKYIYFKKDGVYELPATIGTWQGFNLEKNNDVDVNITVTQIPDYPNSLCYAGKQYCKAYGLPILDDYTIIARRTWFDKDGTFANKGSSDSSIHSLFVFENKANDKTVIRTASFGSWNNVDIPYEGINWQTKNKYNNADIVSGIKQDGSDVFTIGGYNLANAGDWYGCHDDIIIFKRSLTINEINDITEAIFNETIIKE